jgi:PKD repeat protein
VVTVSSLPSLTLNTVGIIHGLSIAVTGSAVPGASGLNITTIHWDWGDGTTEEHWFPATHKYEESGTYRMNVTAYQSDGQNVTKSISVTVNSIPTVTFKTPVINGLTVSVDGGAIPSTSGLNITRINWSWGDGTYEDHWFPATHTYAASGTYKVNVTAYQSDGQNVTSSLTITVNSPLPSLTLKTSVTNGLSVSIDGSATPSTSGLNISRIVWDWGDGTHEDHWFMASHTYRRLGTYTVTVTAIQSDGQSVIHTASVTVNTLPTLASVSSKVNGPAAIVNGNAYPGGINLSITNVNWNWGDNMNEDHWLPNVHRYAIKNTYTVNMIATQGDGQILSKQLAVSVDNAPKLTINTPTKDDKTVMVTGSAIPGAFGSSISRIQWQWGDNSTEYYSLPAIHTYNLPGTYTIMVIAEQDDGQTVIKTTSIRV